MVGHGGSSASSYLADPTSPIPCHCASIVVTSTLRVNIRMNQQIMNNRTPVTKSKRMVLSCIDIYQYICYTGSY